MALALAAAALWAPHPVDPRASWTFSAPVTQSLQHGHRGALTISARRRGASSTASPQKRLMPVAAEGGSTQEVKLSSMSQSTVNLVKNIVGAGMLSLPAGVAAFSGSSKALLPSLTFTLLLGFLSAYGFVLIADACSRTGESTYQGAWGKLVSPGSKWLPTAACIAKATIGCISFSMILADCATLILEPLGLPLWIDNRTTLMLATTVGVLLPLCSMKSLAPLAKFSVLGVLSNVYICAFIAIRCLDGSYQAGGAFARAAMAAPKFLPHAGGSWSTMFHPDFSVLLAILSTAFLAHYNAPLFYEQLAPGPDGEKGGRFATMSMIGFGAAGVIFCLVLAGGFLTFGSNCSGLILNNYAAGDRLAILARGAIGLSLVTAYPLVFFSLRKQFLNFLGQRGTDLFESRPGLVNLALLGGVTVLALNITDLGRLSSFAGAGFGTFLIYIAPAIMALRAHQRGIGPKATGRRALAGRIVQSLLIPLGLSLGAIGVFESLK